ncbi:MAG: non-hydrolyzing UDP-N-acetylglucosamine 2-epimerase [bacterium JZ-2024 1]
MASVMVIFGTQPEAIKLAPVIREAQRHPEISVVTVSTGQHREILAPILEFFGIVPDIELAISHDDDPPSAILTRAMTSLEPLFVNTQPKPEALIVQGDHTGALAATLTAAYCHLPVAHIEGGLRSGDFDQPFPEEINRVLIDRISHWHFVPTEKARTNLLHEGIPPRNIHLIGNTLVDALRWARDRLDSPECTHIYSELKTLTDLDIRNGVPYLLVSAHRRESFGAGIAAICEGLRRVTQDNPDLHIFWPIHPNPRILEVAETFLRDAPRVHLLPPLDYPALLALLSHCRFVLTDSGGIQEEASSFHKPVLVLRTVSERQEPVDLGGALLVRTDPDEIEARTMDLLCDQALYARLASMPNPFGDGRAAERILRVLTSDLSSRRLAS